MAEGFQFPATIPQFRKLHTVQKLRNFLGEDH